MKRAHKGGDITWTVWYGTISTNDGVTIIQ